MWVYWYLYILWFLFFVIVVVVGLVVVFGALVERVFMCLLNYVIGVDGKVG